MTRYDISSINDFVIIVWLVLVYAFVIVYVDVRKQIPDKIDANFFKIGLTLKILGGFLGGLIYQLAHIGGDTRNYFIGANGSFNALFAGDFEAFWYFLTYSTDDKNIMYSYWAKYGSVYYYAQNESAWFIVRIASVLNIFAFNSYYTLSLFFSIFSFSGCWALYKVFSEYYPKIKKQLGWVIFYLPSLWFWGAGLLKDTVCLGAIGWLTYLLFEIVKKGKFRYIVSAALIAWVIFKIKSYILLSFIPFALIWLSADWVDSIKNKAIKRLFLPLVITISGGLGIVALNSIAANSKFAMDNLLEHLAAHSNDLKQAYYYADGQGSSFDLGPIDGTVGNLLSKIPIGIFTGLFRPSLLDVRNPFMLLSALESTLMMLFFLYLLYSIGFVNFFRGITKKPLILFCISFSILFVFFVAVSTSNFGSMVRYRIPSIPYFLSAMYMIYYESKYGTAFKKMNPQEVDSIIQNPQSTKHPNPVLRKKRSLRSYYH